MKLCSAKYSRIFGKFQSHNVLVVCLLFTLLITGCSSTRWVGTKNNDERQWYADPEFSYNSMHGQVMAIGGLVLRDGAPLDRFCDIGISRRELTHEVQSDLWAPMLGTASQQLIPDLEIINYFAVKAETPPKLLKEVLAVFARRGVLKPQIVQELAANLKEAQYLALARIEDTWLDGTGQSSWSLAQGTGRAVAVTVDIYDLQKGYSVWSYMVQKQVLDGLRGEPSEKLNLADGPTGSSGVNISGTTKNAPSLEDSLDDVLFEAIQQLKKTK